VGSLFSAPKISVPPAPEPKDYNVDDRVSGRKTTIVTAADGSKTAVIENSYTPEQQAEIDNLKRIGDDALKAYEGLVADPYLDTMPEYKDQISRMFETQRISLNDAFRDASRATETAAARFGVDDSTAATQLRAQNTSNLAGAQNQLENDKLNTINAVRQQEMSNQLGLYGLASGRQDTLFAQGMQTLGLGNQVAMANAARQDQYQANLFNARLGVAQANQNAQAKGLGTIGQLAGLGLGIASGGMGFGAAAGFGGAGLQTYRDGTSINWANARPRGF
jgi:hypothetical protein